MRERDALCQEQTEIEAVSMECGTKARKKATMKASLIRHRQTHRQADN